MRLLLTTLQKNINVSKIYETKTLYLFFLIVFFLLGLYLRMSGLFRGLGDENYIFHPDSPKQIRALLDFLNGHYVNYYGNLFYDGYPYGLNHLDEYLLRPIFFFFGTEIPDKATLFIQARFLRLTYSIIIMIATYQVVLKLLKNKSVALLALLLISIAPLPTTVTHFATGDIGVDLFTALCLIFLLLYINTKQKIFWLFCCGVSIGSAFSAKYNGLLIAMIPGIFLTLEFLQEKKFYSFLWNSTILITGTILGIYIFTPNLYIDFQRTSYNILANFDLIKNYAVPQDILEKTWLEKSLLGLQKNSLHIISSLGSAAFLSCLMGVYILIRELRLQRHYVDKLAYRQKAYLLSIALFPVLALLISLSGKYKVQPFHFSYFQVPLIITICYIFSFFKSSSNKLVRGSCLVLIIVVIAEFGIISIKENFFWRKEDSKYYAKNFNKSIYKDIFLNHQNYSIIRSLYIEPHGLAVFRNYKNRAEGPDGKFWNNISVAPVPQVPNAFGKDWVFMNGPSFPKNERMIFVHGGKNGTKLTKNIVLPVGGKITGIGIRTGSYATEAKIEIGHEIYNVALEAHQQKTIDCDVIGKNNILNLFSNDKVEILPFKVTVPHDDIWITLMTSSKEKLYFKLFGNEKDVLPPTPPASLPLMQNTTALKALTHTKYLKTPLSWEISAKQQVPMWGIAIPAGRYRLKAKIDGYSEESIIEIGYKDAKGDGQYSKKRQKYFLNKGIQTIEYELKKTFSPYQIKIVMNGIKGKCKFLSLELHPDYEALFSDFDKWHKNKKIPAWMNDE